MKRIDNISESELDLLREHERMAVGRLIAKFGAYAERIAGSVLTDSRDREEAVQDSFVKAIRQISRYDGNRSQFYTWFGRIVYNTSIDKLKQSRRNLCLLEDNAACRDITETIEDGETESRISILNRAIDSLIPEDRVLLHLVYYQGATLHEAALILSSTENALSVRLHRLRKKLKKLINDEQ